MSFSVPNLNNIKLLITNTVDKMNNKLEAIPYDICVD